MVPIIHTKYLSLIKKDLHGLENEELWKSLTIHTEWTTDLVKEFKDKINWSYVKLLIDNVTSYEIYVKVKVQVKICELLYIKSQLFGTKDPKSIQNP